MWIVFFGGGEHLKSFVLFVLFVLVSVISLKSLSYTTTADYPSARHDAELVVLLAPHVLVHARRATPLAAAGSRVVSSCSRESEKLEQKISNTAAGAATSTRCVPSGSV